MGQGLQNLKMRPALLIASHKLVVAVGLEQAANSNVKNIHFVVLSEALVRHLELLEANCKENAVQVHRIPGRKSLRK